MDRADSDGEEHGGALRVCVSRRQLRPAQYSLRRAPERAGRRERGVEAFGRSSTQIARRSKPNEARDLGDQSAVRERRGGRLQRVSPVRIDEKEFAARLILPPPS